MAKQEDSPWQYKPDGSAAKSDPLANAPASEPAGDGTAMDIEVAWTASEYVNHPHGAGWYLVLAFGTAALAAGIYFWTKDYFAPIAIVLVGAAVGIFAARKPREINYHISGSGLQVGEKTYSYSQFRSFSLLREGNLSSISLMPLKRFMAPVSAYFDPNDEQKIIGALGEHLPYEERKPDQIDRLSQRLRF